VATVNLTVNPVNDAPVLVNLGPAPGPVVFEQATTSLDTDVTISDAELDALNGGAGDYAGAFLTVQGTGGFDSFGFSLDAFTVVPMTSTSGDLQLGEREVKVSIGCLWNRLKFLKLPLKKSRSEPPSRIGRMSPRHARNGVQARAS
jgi:hypothetical protein